MPQSDDELRVFLENEQVNEQTRIEIGIRNNQSIFTGENAGKMGTSERAKQWMETNTGLAFVNIVEVLQLYNKSLKKLIRIGRVSESEIEDLKIRVDESNRRVDLVNADIAIDKSALEKRCAALEKRCAELEKKDKLALKAFTQNKNKINILSESVLTNKKVINKIDRGYSSMIHDLDTRINSLQEKIVKIDDLEDDLLEIEADIIQLQKGQKPPSKKTKKK